MVVAQDRYITPQEHRENATEFYKLVLKRQQERQGAHGRNSRLAAIGLPAATAANAVPTHVKRFIAAALADGTPWDDLVMLVGELERLMQRQRTGMRGRGVRDIDVGRKFQ